MNNAFSQQLEIPQTDNSFQAAYERAELFLNDTNVEIVFPEPVSKRSLSLFLTNKPLTGNSLNDKLQRHQSAEVTNQKTLSDSKLLARRALKSISLRQLSINSSSN